MHITHAGPSFEIIVKFERGTPYMRDVVRHYAMGKLVFINSYWIVNLFLRDQGQKGANRRDFGAREL